jgi:hypothetical protein
MGQRPADLQPPPYLTPNTPVPEPDSREQRRVDPLDRDPTRYGDWELKGVAVDF